MTFSAPHILCVNPWIHDFAAFDFWAKPLGLLFLASILRNHGARVSFIDCLDRFHPQADNDVKVQADGRGPLRKETIPLPRGIAGVSKRFSRYGIAREWFFHDLETVETPDLVLVTSLMTYWAPGVKETIAAIKTVYPSVPVVLGGIYASLCTTHAETTTMADQVVTGMGETVLEDLVRQHTGFRLTPSPAYSHLEELPWPALDLVSRLTYAPVMTSRGCPFSCDYCASSFLQPDFQQRSPDSVFQEIQHWHVNHGVANVAFYDDALLVNQEALALPLFEKIIASGMKIAFHTPNALHIREITGQSADLMFKAGFHTIRLGLETTDLSPSRCHDGKVTGNEFSAALGHLKTAGFDSSQIGAYLLCGLPDQSLSEVKASVLTVREHGVTPVLAYYTPIPHTPIWKRAVEQSRFDLEKDPIFTNNALFPCLDRGMETKSISRLKNLSV